MTSINVSISPMLPLSIIRQFYYRIFGVADKALLTAAVGAPRFPGVFDGNLAHRRVQRAPWNDTLFSKTTCGSALKTGQFMTIRHTRGGRDPLMRAYSTAQIPSTWVLQRRVQD